MNERNRHTRPLLVIRHYLLDGLIISAVLFINVILYLDGWQDSWNNFLLVAMLLHAFVFGMQSYYLNSRYEKLGPASFRLVLAWSLVVLGLLGIGFLTKSSSNYSRFVVLLWSFATPCMLHMSLLYIRLLKRRYDARDAKNNHTLVIGTDIHAYSLYKSLRDSQSAETCIGLVSLESGPIPEDPNISLLGDVDHIRSVVTNNHIRKIYIALGLKYSEKVEAVQFALLDLNVDVIWAPDIHNFNLINHSTSTFQGQPLIAINQSPLTSSDAAALAKNSLDRLLALVAIIVFSPLMLATAIAVKTTSRGPTLFIQERTGFDGEIIQIWKFRSMKVHNGSNGEVIQAKINDERLTNVGNFIRSTSLDELPQFFNVLRGEMSLVGPRPHAIAHNELYSKKINAYMARHRMKPGITGWAQVHGYRGETDTDEKMEIRVQYDLEYINNWSIWMDIKILAYTPISLVKYRAH